MNGNKEFIESLSRMIKTKRVALGLDSDITEIKSLSKYIDIKSVKLPAKFDDFKSVRFKYVSREFDMFQSTIYTSHRDCERDSYVFSKIISEVSKKVATDMLNLSEQEDCENKINGYIKQYTDFNNLKVEMLDDTYENMDILDNVLSKLKKSTFTKVKVTNNNPEAKNKEFVGILDSKINNKIAGHWYSRMNHSKEIHVRDFVWIVAVGRVIKECCKYFRKDVDRAREILFRKMYPNRIFEEQLSLEETIKRMDSSFICSEMEKVRYYQLPESLMGFINHCMASMVEETGVILEYEAGIRKDMDSKYASSYETKANITKKMQGFMSNNNFLNMFGYVEADDMCDLEKLNQISNEFIEYTELLPVPVSKSNSLRFRRLGKNKAAGLYFPFAKCLCVDINSASAFTHEMFHMIDFMDGLISLDYGFRKIVTQYKRIVNQNIEDLGEDNQLYKSWNSKGKYNKDYYFNNKEIFARAGELYVSDVLNIKTSLNQREYVNGIDVYVYPKNENFLNLIKEYFDNLFDYLKKNYQIVDLSHLDKVEGSNCEENISYETLQQEKSENVEIGDNTTSTNVKTEENNTFVYSSIHEQLSFVF